MDPRGRSGQVRRISPPPAFDSRTFQPAASRYTDYANPARLILMYDFKIFQETRRKGDKMSVKAARPETAF